VTRPAGEAGRIGRGITIRGTLRGKEDLVVEGVIEGTIALPEGHLTLERSSDTRAAVSARDATIKGKLRGNTEVQQRLEVTADAVIIGDIRAPRLVIQEGARFKGTLEMEIELPPDLVAPPAATPGLVPPPTVKPANQRGKNVR